MTRPLWPFAAALWLVAAAAGAAEPDDPLATGRFAWKSTGPLLAPVARQDECRSVKDPTVVQVEGRWHLFVTIRSRLRTHQIEYLNFTDWAEANRAERHILQLLPGYFCAPQVFWFTPHRRWYLLFQIGNPGRQPGLLPAFSTTASIDKPDSWSTPQPLYDREPPRIARWIDFWIICDDARAYLFATSNDGKMWRAATQLADFPHGWSQPELCLTGDFFEASHTYRLKGRGDFLTVVEAQRGARRYYKAYLADKLDGVWKPLADRWESPFAGRANVTFTGARWSDSISHGELTRSGYDERMEVDPRTWKFVYQGVLDPEMAGKPYGEIPWRLGLLEKQ